MRMPESSYQHQKEKLFDEIKCDMMVQKVAQETQDVRQREADKAKAREDYKNQVEQDYINYNLEKNKKGKKGKKGKKSRPSTK